MKKILAIVLMMALMAVLACSAFASGEPSAAPAAGAAEAADAAPTPVFEWRVITAPTATEDGLRGLYGTSDDVLYLTDVIPALGADDNFAAWKDYVKAYALAGAPNEEEGQTVAGLIDAAASVEEVEAIAQLTVLFESVGVLGYDAWIAAGMPAADVEGMGSEADNQASGEAASAEPAGEASAEPAASEEPAGDASAEPSAEPAEEEAAAEETALANPDYNPNAPRWASIEIVLTIVIVVVGAILMLSFGKKKID